MSSLPPCPQCKSEFTYEDGDNFVCPECAHEWPRVAAAEEQKVVRDANGNVLQDGDSVTVIKDLKVKGSSSVVKVGPRSRTSAWWTVTTTSTARSRVSVPCSSSRSS